jgi:hypothetical protein
VADRIDLSFSGHALRRMFERAISTEEIRWLVENGETIEDYPTDFPFPSRLVGGTVNGRQLHAVVAVDGSRFVVVTTYEPDPGVWNPDGRTRRKP